MTDRKERNIRPRLRRLQYLGYLTIVSGLLIILLEALAATFLESDERKRRIALRSAYQANSAYIHKLKPSIERHFYHNKSNGSHVIQWSSNRHSFRGPELGKRKDHARVLVYGDSNIQGRFSKLENTFTYLLGSILNSPKYSKIQTVNGGTVGFGPDQNLLRIIDEADQIKPDLIIFHIFADNDFGDIIRNRLFSLSPELGLVKEPVIPLSGKFPRESNLKLAQYLSNLSLTRLLQSITKKKENRARQTSVSPQERSAHRAKELFDLDKKAFAVYAGKLGRSMSVFEDHYDISLSTNPESDESKEKIQLMEAIIKKASEFSQASGIEFMVLIQPSEVDLTKRNGRIGYAHLESNGRYRRSNLTDIVERICVSHDIHFVNLFETFARNEPDTLYFKSGDDHWNDRGQLLAAREVAKYILENQLIP